MKCPRCGYDTRPLKTWHLTSPLPDADGRISITIMGSFKCPSCGHSWRGKVSVLKVGGGHDVEIGEGGKKLRKKRYVEEARESGKVIEIDVSEVLSGESE
ncbi:MAG: chromatin protein Cren7 [Sulfolobales archaeon]